MMMKKILLSSIGVVCIGASIMAFKLSCADAKFPPNVSLEHLDVSELTREEAIKKLTSWWDHEKTKEITLTSPELPSSPQRINVNKCGVELDLLATVEPIKTDSLWAKVTRKMRLSHPKALSYKIVYAYNPKGSKELRKIISQTGERHREAKAILENGTITLHPEVPGFKLNEKEIIPAVLEALKTDKEVLLPIAYTKKRVSDEQLHKIKEVRSQFSTTFSASKGNRSSNIMIATKAINGTVVLPGEKFSFNSMVGRRTEKGGYKTAPIFKGGKVAMGIGGGVCQVSTTLYNAAALANLKIIERHSHSRPIPYVPVGRDATVSYGSVDLVFQNNLSFPIAIAGHCRPGKLTFYILGPRDPDTEVRLETVVKKMWSPGVEYVYDRNLQPGEEKVVNKGGRAGKAQTYRVLLKNGTEVFRELLNHSNYKGGRVIIARNPKGKKKN